MLPKHWVRGTPVTHDDLCGVRMSLPIETHPAHSAHDAIARRQCLAIVHWTPATGARFRGADACTASRSIACSRPVIFARTCRSRGGFVYGVCVAKVTQSHCYLNPTERHGTTGYKVRRRMHAPRAWQKGSPLRGAWLC